MSQELAKAGLALSDLGQEMVHARAANEDRLATALRIVNERKDKIRSAREALAKASAAREQVDPSRLPAEWAARLTLFDETEPTLRAALDMIELAPQLFGMDGSRLYLVLAQNETELRPTGGFITAAGYVGLDHGRVITMEMRDSYGFDDFSKEYPWPPEPIREYMAADMWLLRDANWSPDFPSSAQTAADLFKVGTGLQVDGVVALDQFLIQYLLEALGPIDVPTDQGVQQVAAGNFREWMYQRWEPDAGQRQDHDWWLKRKSFVSDLTQSLRTKLEQMKDANLLPVAKALYRALMEKHLAIYSQDHAVADQLGPLGWDGHVDRTYPDYLMVVEANIGFNKASASIERQLSYQLELEPGGKGNASVALIYQNKSRVGSDSCDPASRYDPVYTAMMNRCYWNYLRLIVPSTAVLKSAPDTIVSGKYLLRGQPSTGSTDAEPMGENRQSWGHLFLIEPGGKVNLEYVYELPAAAVDQGDGLWTYRLKLQKQPGLRRLPSSVQIVIPKDATIVQAEPRPSSLAGQALSYTFDLAQDQTIVIKYSLSGAKPGGK